MIHKYYITPQELMDNSLRLTRKIFASGFKPNFIVAIWRGGAPVGIVIQELFEYFGVFTDHIAIKTSYYTGINATKKQVRVFGLDYLINNISSDDSLLIVDDVFDTGNSIKATLKMIKRKAGLNAPEDIRVATPYYKPLRNQNKDLIPDYYVVANNDWLVFPHEIKGLTDKEIYDNKPWMAKHLMPWS